MHPYWPYRVASAALLALFLAGSACEDQSSDSSVDPNGAVPTSSAGPDDAVRVVAEEGADLSLWVSNQSFEDERVAVLVSIDGVEVVDESFAVEGQHNWVLFPLAVPAGEHRLVAVSGTGVELERTITLPKGDQRFAVLDYWYKPNQERRFFDLQVSGRPPLFG